MLTFGSLDLGQEKITNMPQVRAKFRGFYNGVRIQPGELFDLDPEHPVGKWMEVVNHDDVEDSGPQNRALVRQDPKPKVFPAPKKWQNRNGTNGKAPKLVNVIRELCIICVGGSQNGRKPLKLVRECPEVECPGHPFRMGKNPFDKRNLTETQRKAKAALIRTVHFPDNLSQK